VPLYISRSIEVILLYFAAVVVVALWLWTIAQMETVRFIKIFQDISMHRQDHQSDAVTRDVKNSFPEWMPQF